MVYHIPSMLKAYGNLRQFSGQGICTLCACRHTCIIYMYIIYVSQEWRRTMIPWRGITSPATNMMLLERLLGATTDSMSSNRECGDTQLGCGRRSPTAREIRITGRVVGSKQWGSDNELSMRVLLKAEYCWSLHLYTWTSYFKSYTPLHGNQFF